MKAYSFAVTTGCTAGREASISTALRPAEGPLGSAISATGSFVRLDVVAVRLTTSGMYLSKDTAHDVVGSFRRRRCAQPGQSHQSSRTELGAPPAFTMASMCTVPGCSWHRWQTTGRSGWVAFDFLNQVIEP